MKNQYVTSDQKKTETHRKRIAVVGNLIDYPGEVRTHTPDSTTMKQHVNSAIFDIKF